MVVQLMQRVSCVRAREIHGTDGSCTTGRRKRAICGLATPGALGTQYALLMGMNAASNYTASPTKLRTGDWGARVKGAPVSEGDVITIVARSGKSWDARVTRVVWSGDGVTICATASLDRRPPAGPVGPSQQAAIAAGDTWWLQQLEQHSAARSSKPRAARGRRTGCSCGSREDRYGNLIPSPRNCWQCEHDA